MICTDVVLMAPYKRSSYILRYIHSTSNEVSCTLASSIVTQDEMMVITIPLCDKKEGTRKEVEEALYSDKSLAIPFSLLVQPQITKYILEDGQVILHIEQNNDEQYSMLIQAKHVSYGDKDWREAFWYYWQ